MKEHHIPLLKIILRLKYRDELRKVCNLSLIDDNLSAFHVASRLESETVIKLLLKVCEVKTLNEKKCMTVHHVAEKNHLKIVKLLSNAKKARVDVLSKLKRTSL